MFIGSVSCELLADSRSHLVFEVLFSQIVFLAMDHVSHVKNSLNISLSISVVKKHYNDCDANLDNMS